MDDPKLKQKMADLRRRFAGHPALRNTAHVASQLLDLLSQKAEAHRRREAVNLRIEVSPQFLAPVQKLVRAYYPGVPFEVVVEASARGPEKTEAPAAGGGSCAGCCRWVPDLAAHRCTGPL